MSKPERLAFIPIHLDSLYTPGELTVSPPETDFTRLNYTKGENPSQPYLGNTLKNPIFKEKQINFNLEPGVHLHWALPDALCKSMSLPLVGKQSFLNIFGLDNGTKVWDALLKANWLSSTANPQMAKVLLKREDRLKVLAGTTTDTDAQASVPTDLTPEQWGAVNDLLDHHGFPAAPNRWLVSRFTADGKAPEKQWIVESDFVWTDKNGQDNHGQPLKGRYTSYPKQSSSKDSNKLDYCFLGRWFELGATPSGASSYLPDPLTCVGYGNPSFAAFYPNCQSVFGYCDREGDGSHTYEVIGWHSDSGQDYYQLFITDQSYGGDKLQLLAAIQEEFRWYFPIDISQSGFSSTQLSLMEKCGWIEAEGDKKVLTKIALHPGSNLGAANGEEEKSIRATLNTTIGQQLPTGTLYYARCTARSSENTPAPSKEDISLAVGNTSGEAMSAFLANKLCTNQKGLLEDYFEALQLSSQLQNKTMDLGQNWEKVRHQNGFNAIPSGIIWTIRNQRKGGQKADVQTQGQEEEHKLPVELADLLNELNIIQQQFNQSEFNIESIQQQLFMDWCSYLNINLKMASEGQDLDPTGQGDDPDPTGQGGDLDPTGQGNGLDPTGQGDDPDPTDQGDEKDSGMYKMYFELARQFMGWEIDTVLASFQIEKKKLNVRIQSMVSEINTKLASGENKSLTKNAQLQTVAAPRYWVPTDPAIMITGFKPSSRHAQDGRLRSDNLLGCTLWNGVIPVDKTSYLAVLKTLEDIKSREPDNFALHPETEEWHPLFMDWGVNFTQAKDQKGKAGLEDGKEGENKNPFEYSYDEEYLKDNYILKLEELDFSRTDRLIPDSQQGFRGRSILTNSGSLIQKKAVVRNMIADLLQIIKDVLGKTVLDKASFLSFLNDTEKGPKDTELINIAKGPVSPDTSDEQVIINWIELRLNYVKDKKVPEILNWYWQQLQPDLKNKSLTVGDSNIDQFVAEAFKRIQIKKSYYKAHQTEPDQQADFFLQNDPNFIPYLKKLIGATELKAFFDLKKMGSAKEDLQNAYLTKNFNNLIRWYQDSIRKTLHRVLDFKAFTSIINKYGLSQALSGFNRVLLNLSTSYQLNIANPFDKTEEDKSFTDKLRTAIQNQNLFSPMSSGDFTPIRNGFMEVEKLNLLNNFGQKWELQDKTDKELPASQFAIPQRMIWESGTSHIKLSPRLSVPARIKFRWISARHSGKSEAEDLGESNAHPATSPICGWFLPNNLDNSLMVYQADGKALGYIDDEGQWRVFPGNKWPLLPQQIENKHLGRVVERLCYFGRTVGTEEGSFISDLMATLDRALDNIHPENTFQQASLSLLMGRPIALVRASLEMEQRGLSIPFHRSDASGNILSELVRFGRAQHEQGFVPPNGFQRNTFGYEKVKVPVRIGEFHQVNDGLLGFWIDKGLPGSLPNGATPDIFFTPQTVSDASLGGAYIRGYEDGTKENFFRFHLSLTGDKPIELSMLIDPRAKIHATCGVLPVKDIQLPPDQYKKALSNIEIAFLSTPILSLPKRIHLSLPPEPGFEWVWVEKEGEAWKSISTYGLLSRSAVRAVFDEQTDQIWNLLCEKKWIKEEEKDKNRAEVLPDDQREKLNSKDLEPQIVALIERTKITPFDLTASFSGRPEIKEGWLKLSVKKIDKPEKTP